MYKKFLLFIMIFSYQISFANEYATIKGVVKVSGKGIPGANVFIKNTDEGSSTNFEGQFIFKAKPGNLIIVVSSVGYKSKEIKIDVTKNELKELNFELVEDVFGLDQIVISATKTHLNRKEAPVLVTVTNAQLLDNIKSISLLDGLMFQPGLRAEVNCQTCGFTQVRINGLDGAYSQILVNSKPIFSSLNGIYGLEQIPSNMIQQIEIIRGGGSALFGSNAIAGTINVITKDPIENGFQVSSTIGLINKKSTDAVLNFNATYVSENLNKGIIFFGMYRNREGFDYNADSFTEITQLKGINFGLNSFYNFNERKKITLDFNIANDSRRGGNKLNKPAHFADIAEEINNEIINGGINYDYFTKSYFNKFSIFSNFQKTDSENYYGVNQDPYGYGLTKDFTYLIGGQHTVQFNQVWGRSIDLTSGIEYKYNDISENRENINANEFQQAVNTVGLFTQADWKLTNTLKLLTGVRGEYFKSNLQNNPLFILNPRINLLYNLTNEISFRTSYASGFRAPQFYSEDIHSEIVTGQVRRIVISDQIKPEKSDSFMTSFEYNHAHEGHQLIFTLESFYTKLNNVFIYEDRSEENGLAIKEKINGDNAIVKGINIEFKYSPNSNFLAQIGGTIQQAKYSKIYTPEEGITTNKILRTPNIYGNAIVNYNLSKNWKINVNGVFTGAMFVPHLAGFIAENRLAKTPEMLEIGLNTSHIYNVAKDFKIEIVGGVKNIFNSYQKDFDKTINRDSGYIYGPAQPRTIFVGLKIGTDL